MLLAIDCGNGSIKLGLLDANGELLKFENLEYGNIAQSTLVGTSAYEHMIVTDVKGHEETKVFLNGFPNARILDYNWQLPYQLDYKTPHTLGTDRIAAMAGACEISDKRPLLTIDIGTCITYDFINEQNTFIGGAISPGTSMKLEAMHRLTGKLPKAPELPENQKFNIGKSTIECMQAGAYEGTLHEISGFIEAFSSGNKINVVITGGGSEYLANRLECDTFVAPNLILKGLHKIYQLNARLYSA